MRLIWSREAIAIRRAIFDRISPDDLGAAKRMVKRLRDRANSLQALPRQGRRGRVPETFELVVNQTPYIIVYAIERQEVRILTILHHAQQWPPKEA
ncbi:plasmid stabilization system protein [Labrys miyagiensis]|uniref:Plasmid stabilization system protein n=1 Tax=Labrys miyagiensis TaxID=346912 RepID=A0ABQ6CIU3_9HYPH|nr:type II toxin-antitoxin system RelE/ParE family toxin [Labrys miyagiensis]GLS18790.1 plasmid stabilization system protein [Labrys miyagiensis]